MDRTYAPQLDEDGKRQLKEIAFNNTMLHAEKDQRKFIRDIKTLIRSDTYHEYFAEQETLGQTLLDRFGKAEILGKEDVERFASEQSGLAEEFRASMAITDEGLANAVKQLIDCLNNLEV